MKTNIIDVLSCLSVRINLNYMHKLSSSKLLIIYNQLLQKIYILSGLYVRIELIRLYPVYCLAVDLI